MHTHRKLIQRKLIGIGALTVLTLTLAGAIWNGYLPVTVSGRNMWYGHAPALWNGHGPVAVWDDHVQVARKGGGNVWHGHAPVAIQAGQPAPVALRNDHAPVAAWYQQTHVARSGENVWNGHAQIGAWDWHGV